MERLTLSSKQIRDITGMSLETIRRLVAEKKLLNISGHSKRLLIPKSSLEVYLRGDSK